MLLAPPTPAMTKIFLYCYMVAIIVLKPHCYLTSLSDAQVLPVPGVKWVKTSKEFEDDYIVK